MQVEALVQDVAEARDRVDSAAEDFAESREWTICPPCL